MRSISLLQSALLCLLGRYDLQDRPLILWEKLHIKATFIYAIFVPFIFPSAYLWGSTQRAYEPSVLVMLFAWGGSDKWISGVTTSAANLSATLYIRSPSGLPSIHYSATEGNSNSPRSCNFRAINLPYNEYPGVQFASSGGTRGIRSLFPCGGWVRFVSTTMYSLTYALGIWWEGNSDRTGLVGLFQYFSSHSVRSIFP